MPVTLHSLDRIDPAWAWQPWQPSPADPWSPKWAAHLYRRAAFGASGEDLAEAECLGPQGTLELLLRGRPEAVETEETLVDVGRVAASRDDVGELLAGWWLYAMLQGGHPLREKMTLFWHNHFATSITKVANAELMFRQNCLLRAHALGRFGPLLQRVSKDDAMLVWLDSNSNVQGRPNENYARELMELFSLGVGHYTERDIREAARAFTGWHTDGHSFRFSARLHDTGAKTVLGQTGNWNGDDVVRIVLAQPAAARFLVRKLFQFFVSESTEPSDAFLEPLADGFRKSDYDIAALVRTMLSSRYFYSPYAFHQRIKSPVEYVLGAVRAVHQPRTDGGAEGSPLPQQALVVRLRAMGQQLFAPPNVKGWPGGRSWLNTATMLERDNFAGALALGTLWARSPEQLSAPPRALDPARLVHDEGMGGPEDIVRVLLDLYLPGGVPPQARAKLVAFVAEGSPAGPALDRRVREAVHAILTMAEYHVA
jgi:hypothetical protein